LLNAVVDKKISLIDYEVLTKSNGIRLIGFGRYAGIVGAYNALLAVGKKFGLYELKPANLCEDRLEVERELKKVRLPKDFKVVVTGNGRVGQGALEILSQIDIEAVSPEAYLTKSFSGPVYTQLDVMDYNRTIDGQPFDKALFYKDPSGFASDFMRFAKVSDLYIASHYWDSNAPFIFTREDAKSSDFKIKVVADISCDIDGPVASTLRPSTIADPLYGYDPYDESEVDFMDPKAIGVMAVDNLPCELPKDASADFGEEMLDNILPEILDKQDSDIIRRATETTLEGGLTPEFAYLQDYLEGKE
jgi:hypothetical protein